MLLISIHTFLAEGDVGEGVSSPIINISIHTFLAEGDDQTLYYTDTQYLFQSTPSLRKVTTQAIATLTDKQKFQSTPSLRKVTLSRHTSF